MSDETTTLLVQSRQPSEEGPGDIVGAVANEADVDPDAIGFLDEPRRFNVALTRAKRKAVVMGDGTTVTHADVFADFRPYAQEQGREVRL